jgi:DNA-binding response OmpR family regulator
LNVRPGSRTLAWVACRHEGLGMDVRILGPLEVRAAGRPLPLGGTKQRAVLAMLVLHANQVVSIDYLVDGLWGSGVA